MLPNQTFVFYIGDIEKTREAVLKVYPDKKDNYNVLIENCPKKLG